MLRPHVDDLTLIADDGLVFEVVVFDNHPALEREAGGVPIARESLVRAFIEPACSVMAPGTSCSMPAATSPTTALPPSWKQPRTARPSLSRITSRGVTSSE